jgi:hypothetical protein
VPVGLFEDLEDLKAQVAALTNQVKALSGDAGGGPGEGEAPAESETGEAEEAAEDGADEDEWQFPPFILLLDPPEYDEELRALVEWVEGVLVPGYLAEPSADARWCHLWFEHPVAIARLHALWLAWQELTDPATCGYNPPQGRTGPASWRRWCCASARPMSTAGSARGAGRRPAGAGEPLRARSWRDDRAIRR